MRWARIFRDYWLDAVIVAFGSALVLVTFFQVWNRYFFNLPIVGTEEAARFLSVWTILLGAARGVREFTHIRVDFLVDRLPDRPRKLIQTSTNILCLAFVILLFLKGAEILPIVNQRLSPSLRIPLGYVYVAGPISAALMIWYFSISTWKILLGKSRGDDKQTDRSARNFGGNQ